MINKCFYFVFLNLFFFISNDLFWDGHFDFLLSVFFSVVIFLFNYREYKVKDSLVLSIIYLLAFDSTVFYFTDYNIRVWYFYLLIIYVIDLFHYFKKRKTVKLKWDYSNFNFSFNTIVISVFFIWSVFFIMIENNIANLYNIKYWVFYVGLILTLNSFFQRNIKKFKSILFYFFAITLFIMFYGLYDVSKKILLAPNIDFFIIRPISFFSETSWYSEFIFFGLLIMILFKSKFKHFNFLSFCYGIGILLSMTRNTFIGLILFCLFNFCLDTYTERKILRFSRASIFYITVFLVFVFLLYINLPDIFNLFKDKLLVNDRSAMGRIEALTIFIDSLCFDNNFFGKGFYWNSGYTINTGSALGSKSFNLIFMITNIFGIFGALLFLFFVFHNLKKMFSLFVINKSIYVKYSIVFLVVFLQMSMFAPIHQFPFGMLIISLSYFLYLRGKDEMDIVNLK